MNVFAVCSLLAWVWSKDLGRFVRLELQVIKGTRGVRS